MISMPVTDLLYITEIGKALKHADFIWIQDKVIGLDNSNYIRYIKVNPDRVRSYPYRALKFNQKGLSNFCKAITTESSWIVEYDRVEYNNFLSTNNGVALEIKVSMNYDQFAYNVLSTIANIDSSIEHTGSSCDDVTISLDKLYSMKKADGIISFKYDDSHLMYLFPSIIPVNKDDKIFLQVVDDSPTTFISNFIIKKKKFSVYIYLRFLKVTNF